MESHSSDSNNFRSRDLFYSVEGLGKGIWGLRSEIRKTPIAIDMGDVKDEEHYPERVKTEIFRVLREN